MFDRTEMNVILCFIIIWHLVHVAKADAAVITPTHANLQLLGVYQKPLKQNNPRMQHLIKIMLQMTQYQYRRPVPHFVVIEITNT